MKYTLQSIINYNQNCIMSFYYKITKVGTNFFNKNTYYIQLFKLYYFNILQTQNDIFYVHYWLQIFSGSYYFLTNYE